MPRSYRVKQQADRESWSRPVEEKGLAGRHLTLKRQGVAPVAGNRAAQLQRSAASPATSLTIPIGASSRQIHLMLEVQGDHPAGRLTDRCRIDSEVSAREPRSESPQGRSSPRPDPLSVSRPWPSPNGRVADTLTSW